jgi:O-antigen/teichoic acid export membrane protein
MITSIKRNMSRFGGGKQHRTVLLQKNIFSSLAIKGFTLGIGFLLIPVILKYVSSSQYGVWITLSVMGNWITFFDIGLGNGLRNYLAAAGAVNDHSKSRIYVSTAYALLGIISTILFAFFCCVNPFLNWHAILNTHSLSADFNSLIVLIFGLFCLQFVAQLLNSVLTACHRVGQVSVIQLAAQFLTLIGILLLIRYSHSSLFLLLLINSCVPVITLILASCWFYAGELRELAPSLRLVDFRQGWQLLRNGGLFFIIQLGALVLFQTDNIIVIQLFSASGVTRFNIAYKLFSVLILGFNIIIAPFWSAFTDAYTLKDMTWIRAMIRRLRYLCCVFSAAALLISIASPWIYPVWVGKNIHIPFLLSLSMVGYVMSYTWQTLHVYFLNGINKIRLQLVLVIASSIINVPLAIFLGHRLGLAGITLANTLCFVVMGIIFALQTDKLINKTATGIFNA